MEYPFKDLLPLDEVLEREGYYKDWTHLDPKVFYSLTQISEYIKTKGFGVDVRLLIAQLAEHFGLRVTQITDAMAEFGDLKAKVEEFIIKTEESGIKADRATVKSSEAFIKSQNALDVANGIDGKATNALNLSESANALSNSVQDQFNQVIIEGDSSVEAAQARVDTDGIVKDTLKQRLDDEHIEVTNQLVENVARLDDNAISPDEFEGSDFEKVQQAIDYAIANQKGIRLSRMFDITNTNELPLMINIEDVEDRWGLFFYGVGGGLLKKDSGYMFSSESRYVGDIFYNSVRFESHEGAGTKIFDADKIIRVELTSCTIRYVDTIIYTASKYIQSYHFIGGSIIGGNGNAIDCIAAFDLVATSLLVEHRENFFKQRRDPDATYHGLYQVSFRDCCVEGLRGRAYDFHTTDGVIIDGGYMEENTGGHFYMPDGSNLTNLTISNLRVQQKSGNINSHVAINWGGTLKNVKTSNIRGGISIPNHDTTRVISGKVICETDGSNNIPNIDPNNVLVYHTTDIVFKRLEPTFTHESKFFTLKRLYKSFGGTTEVGATTPITIPFSEAIMKDDIVSISLIVPNSPSAKVYILNYRTSNGNLVVNVRNDSAYAHSITLDITILKFPYSTY